MLSAYQLFFCVRLRWVKKKPRSLTIIFEYTLFILRYYKRIPSNMFILFLLV